MNASLFFDFTVNKEDNTIHIQREFAANLPLVWRAWTESELLDQWWGPQPWRAETKTMDFRVGGYWLYAMVGPAGEKHWSRADYLTINQEKSFSQRDGFCDENGTINPAFPQNLMTNSFLQQEKTTLVNMLLRFDSFEALEATIAMGFKEGMTTDFNQLDELLNRQKAL